ncbi:MAG: hypothetical protein WBV94_34710 [Blastocatellia bacterium]
MSVEEAVRVDEGMMLRIAHEIISYEKWRGFVSYARDLYGEAAYEIEATTTSNYDDEGGYFDTIESITVKDRDGHTLDFDYSTGFWTQELEGVSTDEREDKADDIARAYWIDLYPGPPPVYVDEPPSLSFVELYAVQKNN